MGLDQLHRDRAKPARRGIHQLRRNALHHLAAVLPVPAGGLRPGNRGSAPGRRPAEPAALRGDDLRGRPPPADAPVLRPAPGLGAGHPRPRAAARRPRAVRADRAGLHPVVRPGAHRDGEVHRRRASGPVPLRRRLLFAGLPDPIHRLDGGRGGGAPAPLPPRRAPAGPGPAPRGLHCDRGGADDPGGMAERADHRTDRVVPAHRRLRLDADPGRDRQRPSGVDALRPVAALPPARSPGPRRRPPVVPIARRNTCRPRRRLASRRGVRFRGNRVPGPAGVRHRHGRDRDPDPLPGAGVSDAPGRGDRLARPAARARAAAGPARGTGRPPPPPGPRGDGSRNDAPRGRRRRLALVVDRRAGRTRGRLHRPPQLRPRHPRVPRPALGGLRNSPLPAGHRPHRRLLFEPPDPGVFPHRRRGNLPLVTDDRPLVACGARPSPCSPAERRAAGALARDGSRGRARGVDPGPGGHDLGVLLLRASRPLFAVGTHPGRGVRGRGRLPDGPLRPAETEPLPGSVRVLRVRRLRGGRGTGDRRTVPRPTGRPHSRLLQDALP